MIEYRVIERFADSQDENRIYEAGDEFPRKGLSVTDERLKELSGSRNKAGRPFIKEISIKEAEAPKKAQEKPAKVSTKRPIRKAARKNAD